MNLIISCSVLFLAEYAQVTKMLGNGRLEAMCFDGVKRLCHIRGKLRKKVFVNCHGVCPLSVHCHWVLVRMHGSVSWCVCVCYWKLNKKGGENAYSISLTLSDLGSSQICTHGNSVLISGILLYIAVYVRLFKKKKKKIASSSIKI